MIIFILFFFTVTICQKQFSELGSLRLANGNLHNKGAPIYAPSICPENQLLYPGNSRHEWICDCGPGYLYYAPKDGCYAAYRQGPCEPGYHLILKTEDATSKCEVNPCEDGFANYQEKCYELGKPNGPCPPVLQNGGIFDVNATTLKVECLEGTDPLSLFSFPRQCTPGSKRDQNGNCRIVYNNFN